MSGLVLVLANHIGDDRIVRQAIEQVRVAMAQVNGQIDPDAADEVAVPGGALRAMRKLVDIQYVGLAAREHEAN